MISLIVAMSKNRVIGKNNTLPWRMPLEMKHFRDTTMGHHLIIGRRTFESMGSNPIPGRITIVVSNSLSTNTCNCTVANTLDEALLIASKSTDNEIFIGGGSKIFEESFHKADRMYLTIIHADIEGDTFFPEFDQNLWTITSTRYYKADYKHAYDWEIKIFDKKKNLHH